MTMAAKDYRICCALFNAYIAKTSKRDPNVMLEDRRVISEGEILTLIDWYLDGKLGDDKDVLYFNSGIRKGCRVEISYVKSEDNPSE